MRYLARENEAGAKTVYENMKILFKKVARTNTTDENNTLGT